MTRALRLLPALTLAAVLTITASAEYELARTVLALPPGIAWALPVAVDSYVLTAFRSGRDVRPALAVMAGALTAAMGAHLVTAGRPTGQALPVAVTAPAATGIMIVLVVVAWRVHVLIDQPAADGHGPAPAGTTREATAPDGVTVTARVTVPGAVTAADGVTATDAVTAPAAVPASPGRDPLDAGVTGWPLRVDRGSAAAPPSPPRAPAPPTGAGTGVSDEQILAAITGTAPSIRTLMREHRIGRGRAARIQRAAQQDQTATTPEQNHDSSRTGHQENEGETMNRTEARSTTENTEEATTKYQNNARDKEPERPHTGITDRVGQSRSTPEGSENGSGPLPVGFGGAR